MGFVVVIDGNIGSGKSTLLKKLSSAFTVVYERINEWPLDEFYKNPKKWAFALQCKILHTMPRPTHDYCIHERCPQSSNFVFWKHLVDTYQASKKEDDMYQTLYSLNEWKSDVYIYLRCSPEKCFENIKHRVQSGDNDITLKYLKDIHESYENFIRHVPNVKIVDAEQDEQTVYNNVCDILGCQRRHCT